MRRTLFGVLYLNERHAASAGVTKGARHKILVSIKKLGERESAVAAAQAELASAAPSLKSVVRALECLRAVLLSPMPPHCALPAATVQALDLGKEMCGASADRYSYRCQSRPSLYAPLCCSLQVPDERRGGRARAATAAAVSRRHRRCRALAARRPALTALLARREGQSYVFIIPHFALKLH